MTLVPMAFQGALGTQAMLDPSIGDGTGVAAAMAKIVGGGAWVANAVVVMLMLSILLIVMTSMMAVAHAVPGIGRRLAAEYLSHVNEHGSPTRAMWTDLGFNLVLLMMSDYMTVLSISNVCYMLFVFLNLQSGWIHRMDRGTGSAVPLPDVAARRRRDLRVCEPGVCRCGRQPAGRGHAAQRADRDAADRAGVPVPSLLAGSPAQMQRDMGSRCRSARCG